MSKKRQSTPEEEGVTFPGACCACGRTDQRLRNIVSLHVVGPEPGKGWGCFVCHLPADGAMAVVCDECIEKKTTIKYACKGYADSGERVPVTSLRKPHDHDLSKHTEE